MTYTDKQIVDSYAELFDSLNYDSKQELIKNLSNSINREQKSKDELFYESFGAFSLEKSAEEIIHDIKEGRKFREKEIKL